MFKTIQLIFLLCTALWWQIERRGGPLKNLRWFCVKPHKGGDFNCFFQMYSSFFLLFVFFEFGLSFVVSDCSANCTTTTARNRYFIIGQFLASFSVFFLLFNAILIHVIVIDDPRIWTTDHWCRKRPLYHSAGNYFVNCFFKWAIPGLWQ